MKVSFKTFTGERPCYKLVNYDGEWYWDNNINEYTREDYKMRKSHNTRADAIIFLKEFLHRNENLKDIEITGDGVYDEGY